MRLSAKKETRDAYWGGDKIKQIWNFNHPCNVVTEIQRHAEMAKEDMEVNVGSFHK